MRIGGFVKAGQRCVAILWDGQFPEFHESHDGGMTWTRLPGQPADIHVALDGYPMWCSTPEERRRLNTERDMVAMDYMRHSVAPPLTTTTQGLSAHIEA